MGRKKGPSAALYVIEASPAHTRGLLRRRHPDPGDLPVRGRHAGDLFLRYVREGSTDGLLRGQCTIEMQSYHHVQAAASQGVPRGVILLTHRPTAAFESWHTAERWGSSPPAPEGRQRKASGVSPRKSAMHSGRCSPEGATSCLPAKGDDAPPGLGRLLLTVRCPSGSRPRLYAAAPPGLSRTKAVSFSQGIASGAESRVSDPPLARCPLRARAASPNRSGPVKPSDLLGDDQVGLEHAEAVVAVGDGVGDQRGDLAVALAGGDVLVGLRRRNP